MTARPELDALLVNLDWLIAAPGIISSDFHSECNAENYSGPYQRRYSPRPAVLDAGSAAALDARPPVPDDTYRPMPSPYGCTVEDDCGGCACHAVRMAPCRHCSDHWTEESE